MKSSWFEVGIAHLKPTTNILIEKNQQQDRKAQ